jgi:hypothetical protein
MRVARACEALDQGCCLELYYEGHSEVVEVHAVGFDSAGRAWLLGFERHGGADPTPGAWIFVPLDETKRVSLSGYFSAAPRPGFTRDDPRFERVLRQV